MEISELFSRCIQFNVCLSYVGVKHATARKGLINAESSLEAHDQADSQQINAIPTDSHFTRANMALHLDQLTPNANQSNASAAVSGQFVIPVKMTSTSKPERPGKEFKLPHPQKEKFRTEMAKVNRKKQKSVQGEMPSLADIKVLHEKKNEESMLKPNATEITAKSPASLPLLTSMINARDTKLGDVGSLGISVTSSSVAENETIEEPAWKRKLTEIENDVSKSTSTNPETPSVLDIGEIETYKKEYTAAVKGLGPDANLMMKKSLVPNQPRKHYWGVDNLGVDVDQKSQAPTKPSKGSRVPMSHKRYWGVDNLGDDLSHRDQVPTESSKCYLFVFSFVN